MSEGMPGIVKALKLVAFLEELELTDEEIKEARVHFHKADTTHGLLWGNIANFGRETKGLKFVGSLCRILRDVEGWKADENYPLAIVAANLQRAQEVKSIAE